MKTHKPLPTIAKIFVTNFSYMFSKYILQTKHGFLLYSKQSTSFLVNFIGPHIRIHKGSIFTTLPELLFCHIIYPLEDCVIQNHFLTQP